MLVMKGRNWYLHDKTKQKPVRAHNFMRTKTETGTNRYFFMWDFIGEPKPLSLPGFILIFSDGSVFGS